MTHTIAFLGPAGTYAESAALACSTWLQDEYGLDSILRPYPSIAQTLQAAARGETHLAVAPVENSIEGSVTVTLDTVWKLDSLQIQKALVLPISHALLSRVEDTDQIKTIYSHPQALAQCQGWLAQMLPNAQLVATNSTTEAVQHLELKQHSAAIASRRAATLYNIPVLAHPINDHPDNCTRFWVVGLEPSLSGTHTSLAFSFPANLPGALAKALHIFAERTINLSRIESRPTKRSLGEYLFFADIEANVKDEPAQSALEELKSCTETLKIFGSYSIQTIAAPLALL
jgi:prephenate dehydratase